MEDAENVDVLAGLDSVRDSVVALQKDPHRFTATSFVGIARFWIARQQPSLLVDLANRTLSSRRTAAAM